MGDGVSIRERAPLSGSLRGLTPDSERSHLGQGTQFLSSDFGVLNSEKKECPIQRLA